MLERVCMYLEDMGKKQQSPSLVRPWNPVQSMNRTQPRPRHCYDRILINAELLAT
jgi:hypothetical protein